MEKPAPAVSRITAMVLRGSCDCVQAMDENTTQINRSNAVYPQMMRAAARGNEGCPKQNGIAMQPAIIRGRPSR